MPNREFNSLILADNSLLRFCRNPEDTQHNLQLREIEGPIFGPTFSKFPVFFPVSREFNRRKVSAGLHDPPVLPKVEVIYNCGTGPELYPAKSTASSENAGAKGEEAA